MNELKDFIVYRYESLLNANKSNDYQERIHKMTKVLVDFLYNNNLLVNIQPYDKDGNVKLDLVIMYSNLTEDGVEMFKKPVRNWMKAHDRGTRIDKITILEKGLEKIKSAK
ncbi:MAG: hypothetical protein KGV59_04265 [Tenacibaculum sp.]|nr:hypothetical protein [Tenacibaculum sp.]